MKGLIEDKQLAERDELHRKLMRAEKNLAEKDRSIKVWRYTRKNYTMIASVCLLNDCMIIDWTLKIHYAYQWQRQ